MSHKHRLLAIAVTVALVTILLLALTSGVLAAPKVLVVGDGMTQTIQETRHLSKLVLGDDAQIVAPPGMALTLTVNGVETGGVLATTAGVDTIIVGPATYRGDIILTVADANVVNYEGMGPPGAPPAILPFPFRQALYLDATGVVESKSVMAAVVGKKPGSFAIKNIQIRSTGENFDGIFVGGGDYSITNAKINLQGNGRSDFIGYGAAIVARGENTRLVVDGARITNKGVVRSGVVVDKTANVVVKNSYIQTNNGVLPADYVPTIDTTQMRSVPWMLGLSGNVRATNLLGTHTKASYINSYIGSEGWGVLSTDGCTEPTLTAINSTIAITGKDGYGSYGIGNATENFLGCTFNVATYATISRGSFLHFGNSDRAAVAAANSSVGMGLTAKELARIPEKATVVNSGRFGIMWHGGGTLLVDGGTVFNTKEATFLDKGQAIEITVDGSEGVKLNPKTGVILQVMDDDDPGPNFETMQNTNVYHEPPYPPAKIAGWDLTTANGAAMADFSNIALTGDFFNSITSVMPMGPPPGAGPPGPPPSPEGKNMVLTFTDSTLTGVISATEAHHAIPDIYPPEVPGHEMDYRQLGKVTNTAHEAINNGVVVTLNDSDWTVDGTCYLTKLVYDQKSSVVAPAGYKLVVTLDGAPLTLEPGSYQGNLKIEVVAE